jgi:hypothetical protein
LSKFDRIGKIDKEMDSSRDGSVEEQMEKKESGESGSKRNQGVFVTPIAAFHLEIGLVQGAKISNLSDCTKEQMVASNQNLMVTAGDVMESSDNVTEKEINLVPRDDQQIVVHKRDGCYFMVKNKWPKAYHSCRSNGVRPDRGFDPRGVFDPRF